jgi:hypothetical protein
VITAFVNKMLMYMLLQSHTSKLLLQAHTSCIAGQIAGGKLIRARRSDTKMPSVDDTLSKHSRQNSQAYDTSLGAIQSCTVWFGA